MKILLDVVKPTVAALLLLFVLQIHVGENSLEQEAMSFVQQSALIQPLQQVADGGYVLVRNTWTTVAGRINTTFHGVSERTGQRWEKFKLQRSTNKTTSEAIEGLKDKPSSTASVE